MNNQNSSEIWTCTKVDKEFVTFDVLNESTNEIHEERRTPGGFALMLALSDNSPVMAPLLTLQGPGFRFRKLGNGQIYLDGPSIGDPTYHPIDRPDSEM